MTGLAAACSGTKNSDDDDDGGDGGNSGDSSSSNGGSSGSSKGGTSGSTSKGGSSGSSGSAGSSGSSGSSGSFLSDCYDSCDLQASCPGYDASSCATGCGLVNNFVSANVCKAEIEALFDCGINSPDICADSICPTESDAVETCVSNYCSANPSSTPCSAAAGQ